MKKSYIDAIKKASEAIISKYSFSDEPVRDNIFKILRDKGVGSKECSRTYRNGWQKWKFIKMDRYQTCFRRGKMETGFDANKATLGEG